MCTSSTAPNIRKLKYSQVFDSALLDSEIYCHDAKLGCLNIAAGSHRKPQQNSLLLLKETHMGGVIGHAQFPAPIHHS
jgi:hypothetical protein